VVGQVGGLAVGDFNVPRDSWLHKEFVARANLRDAFADTFEPTYRPTPELPRTKAIDQALVSPGLAVETGLVLQDAVRLADGQTAYLSDHYGIELTVYG